VLLSSALVLVGVLMAVVVLTGVFSTKGAAPAKQALATTTTASAVEAERQLIADVTMVPLNGSTGQSPNTLVAVHATGAQLESLKVSWNTWRPLLSGLVPQPPTYVH
jgi:hypothetical protein